MLLDHQDKRLNKKSKGKLSKIINLEKLNTNIKKLKNSINVNNFQKLITSDLIANPVKFKIKNNKTVPSSKVYDEVYGKNIDNLLNKKSSKNKKRNNYQL